MPAIGRNTKVTRLETLTNEQIQQKWNAMLPNLLRYFAFAVVVAAATFAYNHLAHLSQRVTDVMVVVFQIACIFAVCFSMLTGAALYFRTDAWCKKANKQSN